MLLSSLGVVSSHGVAMPNSDVSMQISHDGHSHDEYTPNSSTQSHETLHGHNPLDHTHETAHLFSSPTFVWLDEINALIKTAPNLTDQGYISRLDRPPMA